MATDVLRPMANPAAFDNDMMLTDEHEEFLLSQSQSQRQVDSQELPATQPLTQDSQPSQDHSMHWGYLMPCNSVLKPVYFMRDHLKYTVGRSPRNDVVLNGIRVSSYHCTIEWDGVDTQDAAVRVYDKSSNGTYINGKKVGKSLSSIVRNGTEISFGSFRPQPVGQEAQDHRYIFRLCAGGPPTSGFYSQYDIGNELGKGSFASVLKALCKSNGQWFAVKIINLSRAIPQSDDGEGRTTRKKKIKEKQDGFRREIEILESLQHKNICMFKEAFFEQRSNTICLVLELVEGGDLLDYIINSGGLPEHEVQHITYQLCDALAYIHSRGVAHRDLKPENVLLTRERPNPTVKVADFGLAKVVDKYTMLKTMCGTPSYLAPEVVLQSDVHPGYTILVDSWSTGVIVFSMLTNTSPFLEDEAADIRTRIMHRRVDWDTLRYRNVSHEAAHFIQGFLQFKPEERQSPAQACFHPWLQEYLVRIGHIHFGYEGKREDSVMLNGDDFSYDSLPNSQNVVQCDLSAVIIAGHIPGAYQSISGVQRDRSRMLQRRSNVVAEAEEENRQLPSPSQEMLQAAQYDDGEYSNSSSSNKRRASDIDEGDEEDDDESEGILGKGVTYRAGHAVQGKPTRRTRAAAALMKEQGADLEEEATIKPRRSTRKTRNRSPTKPEPKARGRGKAKK